MFMFVVGGCCCPVCFDMCSELEVFGDRLTVIDRRWFPILFSLILFRCLCFQMLSHVSSWQAAFPLSIRWLVFLLLFRLFFCPLSCWLVYVLSWRYVIPLLGQVLVPLCCCGFWFPFDFWHVLCHFPFDRRCFPCLFWRALSPPFFWWGVFVFCSGVCWISHFVLVGFVFPFVLPSFNATFVLAPGVELRPSLGS